MMRQVEPSLTRNEVKYILEKTAKKKKSKK
jgi:hypothetical protein